MSEEQGEYMLSKNVFGVDKYSKVWTMWIRGEKNILDIIKYDTKAYI